MRKGCRSRGAFHPSASCDTVFSWPAALAAQTCFCFVTSFVIRCKYPVLTLATSECRQRCSYAHHCTSLSSWPWLGSVRRAVGRKGLSSVRAGKDHVATLLRSIWALVPRGCQTVRLSHMPVKPRHSLAGMFMLERTSAPFPATPTAHSLANSRPPPRPAPLEWHGL